MWNDALLAYSHFVALIGTVALLVAESQLCRPGLSGAALHRLKQVDIAYAAFAVLTLVTGLMRVFWGAKGSSFYLSNPVFHAKFGLFVVVGLLSIVPTLRFIAWSKAARTSAHHVPDDAAVRSVRRFILLQLAGVAVLPLLATLMARGLG
jgi:putative membrane protein